MKNKDLKELEEKLEIKFKNRNLLKKALIHRSYLNEIKEKGLESNERLEFLGDAVLELWTTERLFHYFPNLAEGILTNIRAALVRTESLAQIARKLSLGRHLCLSRGEDKNGGRENPSLLADTFEAVTGAIYLDRGWKTVTKFLDRHLLKKLLKLGETGDVKDAKTRLQEIVQAKKKITPHYQVIKEEGPDHAKIFTVAVYFGKKKITVGRGSSKREAEEAAAQKALTLTKNQV